MLEEIGLILTSEILCDMVAIKHVVIAIGMGAINKDANLLAKCGGKIALTNYCSMSCSKCNG